MIDSAAARPRGMTLSMTLTTRAQHRGEHQRQEHRDEQQQHLGRREEHQRDRRDHHDDPPRPARRGAQPQRRDLDRLVVATAAGDPCRPRGCRRAAGRLPACGRSVATESSRSVTTRPPSDEWTRPVPTPVCPSPRRADLLPLRAILAAALGALTRVSGSTSSGWRNGRRASLRC